MSRFSPPSVLWDTLAGALRNPRVLFLLICLVVATYATQHPSAMLPAMAQEDPAGELTSEPAGASLEDEKPRGTQTPDAPIKPWTWMDTFKAGGIIGAIIILLSFLATGLVVEHLLTIRESRMLPETVANDLEQMVKQNRLQEATDYCYDPRNASLATDVVLGGLERYQSSEFGFAEYKSGCEEAGEEATAKLYRKIDMLNLIGVIAPMLGLLGTVQGMIEAFNVIASSGGAAKTHQLADGISKALVTTFEGLVVAIPAMVAYSYFRNRIDHLVAETGKRVERIMSPLSRRR